MRIITVLTIALLMCTNSMAQSADAYLQKAHDYMLAGDENSAYEMYSKVKLRNFSKNQLNEFVRASYFTGHFEDALRASEAGIKLVPRDPVFNRLAMFSSYEIKNYSLAKKYMDRFFYETDGAQFSEYDHLYAALICQSLGDKSNSYYHFNKTLELTTKDSMIKRWQTLKMVSDSYLQDGDFVKAIKYYKEFLMDKTDLTFNDHEGLAKLYSKYADTDQSKKREYTTMAIDYYRSLENKYPDRKTYITNMCSNLTDKLNNSSEVNIVASGYNSDIDSNIPKDPQKEVNSFAFIIANEKYSRVESVPFAESDGKIFAEYCKNTLGIPEKNVHLMINATLGDMKYLVSQMKQITKAFDGDARFVFYFAGHGLPAENLQDAYLLPIDGYGADDTGLSINNLYADMGKLNVKSVVVFLDACFSGSKRDGGMIASSRGVAIKTKANVPQGNLVVFSAAQGEETAYPYREKKHGLFTYFILKKLQETKGNVTLGELVDYATSSVKKTSIVENGKLQTPSVSFSSQAANWRNWKLKKTQ